MGAKRYYLVAIGIAIIVIFLTGFIKKGNCTGVCQCCYCDYVLNGVCIVNGSPSSCIGCVGNCVSTNSCQGAPGQGGCGSYIAWCRDSDCQPSTPPAPPTPPPTPTPVPPCDTTPYVVVSRPAATWQIRPPFPIVIGQDPYMRGVDFYIDAHGGWAEKRKQEPTQVCNGGGTYPQDCPNDWHWTCPERVLEHYDDPLVKIKLTMDLAPSSKEWITGELARVYPGAHIKERFPKEFDIYNGLTMRYAAWVLRSYAAQDPGYRVGDIVLKTAGTPLSSPQTVYVPYRFPVYLAESTIIR